MKKIYLLLSISILMLTVNAQKRNISKEIFKTKFNKLQTAENTTNAAGCDTLNYPVPADWDIAIYLVAEANGGGFVSGTNGYLDKQKAQYFDASATANTYLTSAWIGFGVANSADPSKIVPINVYDGTSGSPGALLGTANVTMGTIIDDVTNGLYTEVVFNPAISLPASKKFFVSADMSNLDWTDTPKDSLAVYTDTIGVGPGGAWEQWSDDTWSSFLDSWGIDLALYIHPFISTNQTCSLLPVHLLSFNAQKKNKDILLTWTVAQELDMKQYEIEKAVGNLQFSSIGTVVATNSQLNHAYSYIDNNGMGAGDKIFYRLKQVNLDGTSSYSNIITFTEFTPAVINVKVINPFRNTIQIQVSSPAAQKLQASVYDLQGKRIVTTKEQVLVAGENAISIPLSSSLPKGMYILNLYVGKEIHKFKIFNQ